MKISEFCLLNGTSLKKNEGKEGYLYLDTANITNGVIDSFQKYGFYEELPSRARRKVSNNSIVYSTVRPNQQHFGIITEPPDNLIVSTGFCVIDVDEKIADPRYVYYYLSQSSITKKLHAIAEQATTAYPSIKAKDLGDLEIDLPDLDRQHEVAQILTSLDKKILLNSAINDNLYEIVDAFYKKLFTAGDLKLTTIGQYMERIYSGGTPSTSNPSYWNGVYNWFSSGETRNPFVVSTEKTITQVGIDNSSTKLANKYDVVIASAGQGFTRGQTSMLLLDTYVNQSVIVLHGAKNIMPYVFWNLRQRYNELRAISDTSSIRGSLTTKTLSRLEIPEISDTEIIEFSKIAWPAINQIENNLNENKQLIVLRDLMLSKLF